MNKIYRLKSSKSFEYIHKHGKSSANNNLVLVYANTKFNLKVGFSVSKKIGKAVVRNKVKRRLRESFRLLIPYLNNNYNYMFIARPNSANCDYHELLKSMKHLLIKNNLVIDKDGFNKIN